MSVWHEIVIECSEKVLRAFVAGYEVGLGHREGLVLGCDLDLEKESFTDRVRDLFEAGSHQIVFATSTVADRLAGTIRRDGEAAGVRLESVREVTGASFSFTVEAYSKDVAAVIRENLFDGLAEGVVFDDRKESEEFDPDARGAELYAPMHDYTFKASATLSGPLPSILEMHRRAADLDFVHAGPIHVNARELG